jgi:hypothetical protein
MEMMIVLFLCSLLLIFGTITAFLAKRKGYNPYIWFFAAWFGLIGLIVLAFMPSANAEDLDDDQKKAVKKRGDFIAIIFVVLTLILVVLNFVFIIWASIESKNKTQETSCTDNVKKIRHALSWYYQQHMDSNGIGNYPSSLHDVEFMRTSGHMFKDRKLPEHPCGKDWNDFYNAKKFNLDMAAACNCK